MLAREQRSRIAFTVQPRRIRAHVVGQSYLSLHIPPLLFLGQRRQQPYLCVLYFTQNLHRCRRKPTQSPPKRRHTVAVVPRYEDSNLRVGGANFSCGANGLSCECCADHGALMLFPLFVFVSVVSHSQKSRAGECTKPHTYIEGTLYSIFIVPCLS